MVAKFGLKAKLKKVQQSILQFLKKMENKIILLVEDNLDDVELTIHAFKKNNIRNEVVVVNDGAEALDFLFYTGIYSNRDRNILPTMILLDLQLPKIGGLEVLRQ